MIPFSRREALISDAVRKLSFSVCSSICDASLRVLSSRQGDSFRSWEYNKILDTGVLVWWDISEISVLMLSFSALICLREVFPDDR